MGKHMKQSRGRKRILASAATVGALAAVGAGTALTGGHPSPAVQARILSTSIVLVDHSVPIPNELLAASCAATDLVCALGRERSADSVSVPSLFVPPTIGRVGPAAPIDPILARLLGAPAQILANPFNVVGPGGWLIGNAITPGANGGLLIGNGAAGRIPGQNGGHGGLLVGRGADGANGG